MATKRISSNATLYVETAIDETHKTSQNPPTTKAVYDALGSVEGDIKAYVYDTIYMSANDKTYAVTIDAQGALAVAEVVEPVEEGGGE